MPQAAPIIASAFAFLSGNGLAAFVARTLLTTAFSMGVNAVFGRKPTTPQFDQGINFNLTVDATYARNVVYGVAKTGGSLVFADETTTTDTNDTLWMVIALADHQCNGVQEIQVNGQAITWNSSTGVVSEFTKSSVDYLKVHFQDGAESQTAYTPLVTASSNWTSDHRGRGVAYIVVEALFNSELFSQIPQVSVVLQGKPLYDPRLDSTQTGGSGSHRATDPTTWEWENGGTVLGDNPALQLGDYMRGLKTAGGEIIGGMNIPLEEIRVSDYQTAATDCEDSITTITPAGTEKRYRSGLMLSTDANHKANIRAILATMAGELHDNGGEFRMFAGKSRSSVLTLTDDDVVRAMATGGNRQAKKWTWEPQAGREERVNTVRGRFVDETNGWRPSEYPSQTSATYVTEDNGRELEGTLDVLGCPSHSQAQRLAKIYLEATRFFGRHTGFYQPAMVELESGDWLDYDSTRQGWTGGSEKTFVVEAITEHTDTTVELKLQEVGSGIYSWTPGTDEKAPAGSTASTVPAQDADYAGKLKDLASKDAVTWGTVDITSQPTWSTDDRVPDTITASRELDREAKIVQLTSGTTQRSIGRGFEWIEGQDGDSITFNTNFGSPPIVRLLPGSALNYATSLEGASTEDQYSDFAATNVTTSGFDLLARLRRDATTTAQSDNVATTGSGSEPDLVGDKSTADEAVDDTYRFTGSITATAGGEGGSVTVGIYTASVSGTWVQRATTTVPYAPFATGKTFAANAVVDGLGQHAGDEFGVSIESSSGVGTPTLTGVAVAYNSAPSVTDTSATPGAEQVYALVFESDEVLT